MTNAKKILITRETHETFILRINNKNRAFGFCPGCENEVEIVSLDEAVSISGLRTSELVRRAEIGSIHAIETEGGHLLFCRESMEMRTKIFAEANEK
ncbi:MAG: hypothetical protein ACREO5_08580 [Candidatus Binatia bacterium]